MPRVRSALLVAVAVAAALAAPAAGVAQRQAEAWTLHLPRSGDSHPISMVPIEGPSPRLVITRTDGEIFGVDARTGALSWRQRSNASKDAKRCSPPFVARAVYARELTPTRPASASVIVMDRTGQLRVLDAVDGREIRPAMPVVATGGPAVGVTVADDVAYVASAGGPRCQPAGVWALDLASKGAVPTSWQLRDGSPLPTFGRGSDGTLYVRIIPSLSLSPSERSGTRVDVIAALEARTLRLKGTFPSPAANFEGAPLVISAGDTDLLVVELDDGRLLTTTPASFDAGAGPPAFTATMPIVTAGLRIVWREMTAWRDRDGSIWVFATFIGPMATRPLTTSLLGGVAAFQLVNDNGRLHLQARWFDRNLLSPGRPIERDGVLYVLAHGGTMPMGLASNPSIIGRVGPAAPPRAEMMTAAELVGFAPTTGRRLWRSGSALKSSGYGDAIVSNGALVVQSSDDVLHAFAPDVARP